MNIINYDDKYGDLTNFDNRAFLNPPDVSYIEDPSFDLINLNNNYYLPLGNIKGTVLENNITDLISALYDIYGAAPDTNNLTDIISLTYDLYGNNITQQ